MKNGVAKIVCTCQNEYQDKRYGERVRLANATAKQDPAFIEVRCTVCSKVQRVSPEGVK